MSTETVESKIKSTVPNWGIKWIAFAMAIHASAAISLALFSAIDAGELAIVESFAIMGVLSPFVAFVALACVGMDLLVEDWLNNRV